MPSIFVIDATNIFTENIQSAKDVPNKKYKYLQHDFEIFSECQLCGECSLVISYLL